MEAPPRHTTIRCNPSVDHREENASFTSPHVLIDDERVRSLLDRSILEVLAQRPPMRGGVQGSYRVSMYEGVDDVVYVDYDIEAEKNASGVMQRYPRIAVDPSAAAALLRGADLMAVGVLATDAHDVDGCELLMASDILECASEEEEERGWGVRKGQWVSVVADVERKVTIGERLSTAGSHLPDDAPLIGNGVCLMVRSLRLEEHCYCCTVRCCWC